MAAEAARVVLQLADRLAHVVEREMRRCLLESLCDLRRPALREFLERAHVEIPVVKEAFEPRHEPRMKRRSWQMLLPHMGERPGSAQAPRNSNVAASAAANRRGSSARAQ